MYKKFYWVFGGLALLYLLVSFGIPPDPEALERYHISALQLRLIQVTVVLPVIAIWFAGFYGFIHFENYAAAIKKSPDGRGLKQMADGLMVLAIGSPLVSVFTSLFRYWERQGSISEKTSGIITNRLPIVVSLVAFWLLLSGASRLIKLVKQPRSLHRREQTLLAVFGLVALIYAVLTISHLNDPTGDNGPVYYLGWVGTLTTIIVPYVFIWACGLLASVRIQTYQSEVEGTIYKQALSRFRQGVIAVVLSSIFIQFLTSAVTGLQNLGLGPLLALVYVLLIVIAAGYVLIAMGAKELKKIEEVA